VRYRAKRQRVGTRNSGASVIDDANEFIVHGFNAATDTQSGTCPLNCSNSDEIYSFHPGGVMLAFGDGSVRFQAENTPFRILAAMVTREGKESIAQ
jgi:prepilin-type processing-associated H-X9-DG protein